MILDVLTEGVALLALGFFARVRLLRYLRYLQLEEYDNERFGTWIVRLRAFDRKGSATAVIGGLVALVSPDGLRWLGGLGIAGVMAWIAYDEEDPRTSGKVRLNLTQRATRILQLSQAFGIGALACLGALSLAMPSERATGVFFWLGAAVFVQLVPAFLMAGVRALAPGEARRQAEFQKDAKTILTGVDPFVIGITGSYGKTTTKFFLGEMLSAKYPTFWPPKSINTPMGITREIRERLAKEHRFAVIEMGAYQRGSIQRLCDLTPPKAGIVTCVGIMHLERYGTEENVFLAKSELAQAIPSDGVLVCNADDPGALRMSRNNPKRLNLLYGIRPAEGVELDCSASQIRSSPEGMHFELTWADKSYSCFAPVHGETMVSNLLAAFTMAAAMDVEPEILVATMRNLRPVDNRLQVIREGELTTVRDAYNSNPPGFRAALDIVAALPGARRVLMTPGMVELGSKQDDENRAIANYAAGLIDLAIVVGPTNRTALVEGLLAGGLPADRIHQVETRDAAFATWRAMQRAGDVLLIENDLPDLYEAPPVF